MATIIITINGNNYSNYTSMTTMTKMIKACVFISIQQCPIYKIMNIIKTCKFKVYQVTQYITINRTKY